MRGLGSEASGGRSGGERAPLSVEAKISSLAGNVLVDGEADVESDPDGCDGSDGEGSEGGSEAELLP